MWAWPCHAARYAPGCPGRGSCGSEMAGSWTNDNPSCTPLRWARSARNGRSKAAPFHVAMMPGSSSARRSSRASSNSGSGPVKTSSKPGCDSATVTTAATAGSRPSTVVSVSMSSPYTSDRRAMRPQRVGTRRARLVDGQPIRSAHLRVELTEVEVVAPQGDLSVAHLPDAGHCDLDPAVAELEPIGALVHHDVTGRGLAVDDPLDRGRTRDERSEEALRRFLPMGGRHGHVVVLDVVGAQVERAVDVLRLDPADELGHGLVRGHEPRSSQLPAVVEEVGHERGDGAALTAGQRDMTEQWVPAQ